jgi:hypothetical protein
MILLRPSALTMQATLDAITEDLHELRSEALIPKLEVGLKEQQLPAFHRVCIPSSAWRVRG